jgi:hypothetical protein
MSKALKNGCQAMLMASMGLEQNPRTPQMHTGAVDTMRDRSAQAEVDHAGMY